MVIRFSVPGIAVTRPEPIAGLAVGTLFRKPLLQREVVLPLTQHLPGVPVADLLVTAIRVVRAPTP
jgi:hypothetical protein